MNLRSYTLSFLSIYYVLHVFGGILSFLFSPLIFWSATNIFDISYSFESVGNGSGDTTYNYLQTYWNLLFALVLAIPLEYIIRKKDAVKVVTYGFLLYLRLYLAFYMLAYGFSKIFPMQFPPISLLRLTQPYGESSPMGLAWTFMQYSPYYSAFTGVAEVIGGLLLLHRRTATFGALVLAGVLSNVVMMNFSYDIPVKLSSIHMLLASLILLTYDRRRLVNFILNKQNDPKEPLIDPKPSTKRVFFLVGTSLKVLLAVGIFSGFAFSILMTKPKSEPVLYGIYETDTKLSSTSPYRFIVFDTYDRAGIRYSNNDDKIFKSEIDSLKHTINLTFYNDDQKIESTEKFTYQKTSSGIILSQDSIKVHLNKKPPQDFLLINRGFHWVNERPFNR